MAQLDLVKVCTRRRIHYGWVLLVVATLGKTFSSPGQSPCIGVAIDYIRADLGESRTTISLLYLIATTTSAATLPFTTGRLIDRLGVRICVVGIAVGLASACFVVSVTQSTGATLVAFFMLRFFGQGSMMNVSVTAINLWWVKRRGTMMGVAGAFVSLGMLAVVPSIMRSSMAAVGWRATYVRLGLACLLFMAPLGALAYRGKPEDHGLLADGQFDDVALFTEEQGGERLNDNEEDESGGGGREQDAAEAGDKAEAEESWTAREAVRTAAFWSFALCQLCLAATGTAFWFHLASVLTESGLSPAVHDSMYPFLAVASITSRLVAGRAVDRIPARFIACAGLACNALGLFLVPFMGSTGGGGATTAYAVAIFMSLGSGMVMTVSNTIHANNFGRKHLGNIQTIAGSLGVLGSALGPLPFGAIRDATGSFNAAFLGAVPVPLCLCALVLLKGRKPMRGRRKSAVVVVVDADPDRGLALGAATSTGRERLLGGGAASL